MLRAIPPPLLELELELPPLQPASAAAATRKNASPTYAYCLLRAVTAASKKLSIASATPSTAKITKGVFGGRRSMIPGGSAERAVGGSVAVQDAPVVLVAD